MNFYVLCVKKDFYCFVIIANGSYVQRMEAMNGSWFQDISVIIQNAERIRYRKDLMPDNYEEILMEAVQLRREVPKVVGPDDMDSENFPSEKSMECWHHWFIFNRMNMEGHIRPIGHRILEYDEELLSSTMSLLFHIRSSIPDIWLKIILRYIYNSGNTLQAFYCKTNFWK